MVNLLESGVTYWDVRMVLERKSSLSLPLLTAAAFDADWQSKALNTNPEVDFHLVHI